MGWVLTVVEEPEFVLFDVTVNKLVTTVGTPTPVVKPSSQYVCEYAPVLIIELLPWE